MQPAMNAALPQYRSHKIVGAAKIKEIADPNNATDGSRLLRFEDDGVCDVCVDASYMQKHRPEVGGYYVMYEDGYQSFSPARAFEEGYTRVEPNALELGAAVRAAGLAGN